MLGGLWLPRWTLKPRQFDRGTECITPIESSLSLTVPGFNVSRTSYGPSPPIKNNEMNATNTIATRGITIAASAVVRIPFAATTKVTAAATWRARQTGIGVAFHELTSDGIPRHRNSTAYVVRRIGVVHRINPTLQNRRRRLADHDSFLEADPAQPSTDTAPQITSATSLQTEPRVGRWNLDGANYAASGLPTRFSCRFRSRIS